MIALDTSIVVAALIGWHEDHALARRAAGRASVPAHALIESYSVLTRLPARHRVKPAVAVQLLGASFPVERVLVPSADLVASLVFRLAEAGIAGGATYDALVGLTAAERGAVLRTRDRRAAATYERLEVSFELVAR